MLTAGPALSHPVGHGCWLLTACRWLLAAVVVLVGHAQREEEAAEKRKENAAATFDTWVAMKALRQEAISCMEVLPPPSGRDEESGR